MKRRDFLLTVGALLAQRVVAADLAKTIYHLGTLSTASAPTAANVSPLRAVLNSELRNLGYVEGQNLVVERRYAGGKLELLPQLAAELVQAKVDLILVDTTVSAAAAQRATRTIPIVMIAVSDPMAAGLIASLARPGGNITGASIQTGDIAAKRLQLLREVLPKMRRIGAFYQGEARSAPQVDKWLRDNVAAARDLGLLFEEVDLGMQPNRWDQIFRTAREHGIDGAVINDGTQYVTYRKELADAALRHRLPMIFPFRDQAEAGGLMSFGAKLVDLMPRVAIFIDKILKGAKPSDLPVEQPTTFELIINLRTAKELGITFPQSILVRADRVIE
jgi:putative ABC transport system substrate-binding protein